jgi:hypothetical protein
VLHPSRTAAPSATRLRRAARPATSTSSPSPTRTHTDSSPTQATLGRVYVHRNVTWRSIPSTRPALPCTDATRTRTVRSPGSRRNAGLHRTAGTDRSRHYSTPVRHRPADRSSVRGRYSRSRAQAAVPTWNLRGFQTTMKSGTSDISTTAPHCCN